MEKRGSCRNGMECSYSHNSDTFPKAMECMEEFDMGRSNVHMLDMGSTAFKKKLSHGIAKELMSWDALVAFWEAKGVKMEKGKLADRTTPTRYEKDRPKPGHIRLIGPETAVKEALEVLRRQKKIIGGLKRYSMEWSFADDPWASDLFLKHESKCWKLLNQVAHNQDAWYEVKDAAGKAAAPGSKYVPKSAAGPGTPPRQKDNNLLVLAYANIGFTDIYVGYTENAAEMPVDAILVR